MLSSDTARALTLGRRNDGRLVAWAARWVWPQKSDAGLRRRIAGARFDRDFLSAGHASRLSHSGGRRQGGCTDVLLAGPRPPARRAYPGVAFGLRLPGSHAAA